VAAGERLPRVDDGGVGGATLFATDEVAGNAAITVFPQLSRGPLATMNAAHVPRTPVQDVARYQLERVDRPAAPAVFRVTLVQVALDWAPIGKSAEKRAQDALTEGHDVSLLGRPGSHVTAKALVWLISGGAGRR
jgi:hypothetical protein